MADFSSLGNSEALLGVAHKNDSETCPQGGDAAKIAGTAIAGIALAGALAVGAAQSSLFSNGIGTTGDTQAAAGAEIASAQAGVTSSANAAASKAASAVGLGPGADANAQLQAAGSYLTDAKAQSTQLAGENRAGADAEVANATASTESAKNYLASQTAEANALKGQSVSLSGAMTKAFTTPPPFPPTGLVKPVSGQLPKSPLPTNVPVPAKAVETTIPTAPENIAVKTPADVNKAVERVSPASIPPIPPPETPKTMVISQDKLDNCLQERTQLITKAETQFFDKIVIVFDAMNKVWLDKQKYIVGGGLFASDKTAFTFAIYGNYGILMEPLKSEVVEDDAEYKDLAAKYYKALRSGLSFSQSAINRSKYFSQYIQYQVKCEDLKKYEKMVDEAVQGYKVVESNEKQLLVDIRNPLWVYGYLGSNLNEAQEIIPNVKNFFKWYLGVIEALHKLDEVFNLY